MKKILFNLFLIFPSFACLAQKFNDNFVFNDSTYTFNVERKNSGLFDIIIENQNGDKMDFSINPLKLEVFKSKFKNKLLPKMIESTITDSSIQKTEKITKWNKELDDRATKLFYQIIAQSLNNESNAPIAGTLLINESIYIFRGNLIKCNIKKDESNVKFIGDSIVFKINDKEENIIYKIYKTKEDTNNKIKEDTNNKIKEDTSQIKDSCSIIKIKGDYYLCKIENNYVKTIRKILKDKATIKDVEIEFYEGFIETIKVTTEAKASNGLRIIRFGNIYGIGFSTRNNFKRLSEQHLFDITSANESAYSINLGELLSYNYEVRPLTRDFSPANQVISTLGKQNIVLKKEENAKLFEAVVFSDFLGLDKENPNGLIQTEISKRVNLNSVRFQTKHLKWLSKGFGWFRYFKPAINISKIEENNRFLPINYNDTLIKTVNNTDSLIQRTFANPLRILQHQNLSLGLDLNILFLDNPDMKYHFYLNSGFRFGRTAIRDSLRTLNTQKNIVKTGLVNDFGINYFTFYPEIILQFLPEERFSISLSYKPQFFFEAFIQPKIRTFDKELVEEKSQTFLLNSFEIMTYLKLSDNGKLFARFRYNAQSGNTFENYHQLQVGYSFYILKKN
jgi:hypothetical protein